ncbi:MAG: sugar phosphate isomerase/epimerase family protein [Pirellulaceae bacterium]|nr:sugar phosphate isomerase/epimerase family protein [Pirellulaceae bacterium]
MERLAISELTTLRWSLEEDVERYAAAGAAGIGVWRQKLADYGEEKGAELIAEAGLAVSSLQWAGGFTGSDGRTHEDGIADGRQAIHLAEVLRAGCLVVHSGARGVHTRNHARRIFRQALDKLLPLAEERGVTLALEPMANCGGSDFTFFNCLEETRELVASYRSPALKIALDTYHWGHDPALLGRLPELAGQLALVQLADSRQPPQGEPNRVPLGTGCLPVREIVATLAAGGYEGFFEVELMGEELEARDYRETIEQAVRTFGQWTAPALS